MGATTFVDIVKAPTAQAAFDYVTRNALHMNGHGGYTGTIGEKSSFVMISVPTSWSGTPLDFANKLLDEDDARISDKWGPAGCIKDGEVFIFFGWASS